eukprot:4625840-Ditylum_brightwellii.AAC.1
MASIDLLKDPTKLEFLKDVNVCFAMNLVRESNAFMGGVLLICTMDYTQIQPIHGHPVLILIHIVPCFKMVVLKTSVCANSD